MKPTSLRSIWSVAELEILLTLRNRATRYYAVIAQTLITVVTGMAIILPVPDVDKGRMILVASLYAPATYGLLAFNWNRTNAAAIFYLPVSARAHLVGRLLAMTLIGVPGLIVVTLFAANAAPHMVWLPLAGGAFTVCVLGTPILLVSLSTPKKLDADAQPMSDLRRFGWQHYAATLVSIVPLYVGAAVLTMNSLVLAFWLASVASLSAMFVFGRRIDRVVHRGIVRLSDAVHTV